MECKHNNCIKVELGPGPLKKVCRIISMQKMFFPQIFCAVGSSSLAISVKLEVTVCNIKVSSVVAGGRPIGKFRHFLPFVGKTIN